VVQDILDRANILEAYPVIGRKVPEIDDESIREIFIYSYRILYEIKSDQAYISASFTVDAISHRPMCTG
jgi:hypothetical protein